MRSRTALWYYAEEDEEEDEAKAFFFLGNWFFIIALAHRERARDTFEKRTNYEK